MIYTGPVILLISSTYRRIENKAQLLARLSARDVPYAESFSVRLRRGVILV